MTKLDNQTTNRYHYFTTTTTTKATTTMSEKPSWRSKPRSQVRSVSMTPDLWAQAESLGEGNISRGLQYAVRFTQTSQELERITAEKPPQCGYIPERASLPAAPRPAFRASAALPAPEPLDPSLETGAASQARAAAVDAALRARAERLRAAKRQADQDQDHE